MQMLGCEAVTKGRVQLVTGSNPGNYNNMEKLAPYGTDGRLLLTAYF